MRGRSEGSVWKGGGVRFLWGKLLRERWLGGL